MIPRIFLKALSVAAVGAFLTLRLLPPQPEHDYLPGIIRLAQWHDPNTGASLNLPFDSDGDSFDQAAAIYQTTYLDLSENDLTMLPPEIGYLENLTVLVLWGNSLTALPGELGNLTHLRELHLNKNNLKSVPPEIGKLDNLNLLYIDHNELQSVPPEMAHLNNLKLLNLSHNQLTGLPSEFERMGNLQALYVRGNREIADLPLLPATLVYQ